MSSSFNNSINAFSPVCNVTVIKTRAECTHSHKSALSYKQLETQEVVVRIKIMDFHIKP